MSISKWIANLFSKKDAAKLQVKKIDTKESDREVQRRIISLARQWGITIKIGEDGKVKKETREAVANHFALQEKDKVWLEEIRCGTASESWSDEKWAQVLEKFLGDRTEEAIENGVLEIFHKPRTIIPLLFIYSQEPELLSPLLRDITRRTIERAKRGKLDNLGKLIMDALPEIRKVIY